LVFFFVSGFKVIAAELEKLAEMRLLIGSASDSQTVEQISETHTAAQLLEQVRKREFASPQDRAREADTVSDD